MQTFELYRAEDETGVSGTGRVAQGVIFDNGHVAMTWLTKTSSVAIYNSIEDVRTIHGHGGKTLIVLQNVCSAEINGHRCVGDVGHPGWHIDEGGALWDDSVEGAIPDPRSIKIVSEREDNSYIRGKEYNSSLDREIL